MKTSYRKSKEKGNLRDVLIISLLTVFLILLFWINLKIIKNRSELNAEIEDLKKNILNLEQKKQEALGKISEADEKDFLEKTARQNFNLKKEGEKVAVFQFEEQDKSQEIKKEELNFWQKILKTLGIKK